MLPDGLDGTAKTRIAALPDECVSSLINCLEAIEVSLGASGKVQVPVNSQVKVYAGKSVDVRGEWT